MKSKFVPIKDRKYTKIPFSALPNEDKRLVLTWMKTAINTAVESLVKRHTYQYFVQSLNQNRPFDVEKAWGRLTAQSHDHFHHSRYAIMEIDKQINALETPDSETDPPMSPSEFDDVMAEMIKEGVRYDG